MQFVAQCKKANYSKRLCRCYYCLCGVRLSPSAVQSMAVIHITALGLSLATKSSSLQNTFQFIHFLTCLKCKRRCRFQLRLPYQHPRSSFSLIQRPAIAALPRPAVWFDDSSGGCSAAIHKRPPYIPPAISPPPPFSRCCEQSNMDWRAPLPVSI